MDQSLTKIKKTIFEGQPELLKVNQEKKLLNKQLFKITNTIKNNHSIFKWMYFRALNKQVIILYTQPQAG